MHHVFDPAMKNRKRSNGKSALRQDAGGRTDAQLDEPLSQCLDLLGQKGRKLFGFAPSCLCFYYVSSCWPTRIGSKLSIKLSPPLFLIRSQKQNRLGSQFPGGLCGGDGGELNSPSKRTHRRMYYRFSRCFCFTLRTPIDRIRQRWPSGL